MRSFNNFLKEATETSASRQAKLLGLVGDGHGGWYDAKGKFVAKTEQTERSDSSLWFLR